MKVTDFLSLVQVVVETMRTMIMIKDKVINKASNEIDTARTDYIETVTDVLMNVVYKVKIYGLNEDRFHEKLHTAVDESIL